ncbi:MAG: 3,4-dihydroxy-2-butanone-4-phosphate synthase [Nitrososphaerales archaeon]
MSDPTDAINALRSGEFVLLHDSESRENEVDMVVAAQFVTPSHIARMRRDAGGLLCLAVRHDIANKLRLLYVHDMMHMLANVNPALSELANGKAPYGDKPAFSIAINHKQTYTGITDHDRAITIAEMAKVCSKALNGSDALQDFVSMFRAPGHVPILIASEGLLSERLGHTELAVYLTQLAGLTPAVAICEMLDGSTYKALSTDRATHYSKENNIIVVEGSDLKMHFTKVQ